MHPKSQQLASLIEPLRSGRLTGSDLDSAEYLIAQETLACLENFRPVALSVPWFPPPRTLKELVRRHAQGSPMSVEDAETVRSFHEYRYARDRALVESEGRLLTLLAAARTFQRLDARDDFLRVSECLAEDYGIYTPPIPDASAARDVAPRVVRDVYPLPWSARREAAE
jgi:hypothetical protein